MNWEHNEFDVDSKRGGVGGEVFNWGCDLWAYLEHRNPNMPIFHMFLWSLCLDYYYF